MTTDDNMGSGSYNECCTDVLMPIVTEVEKIRLMRHSVVSLHGRATLLNATGVEILVGLQSNKQGSDQVSDCILLLDWSVEREREIDDVVP